MNWYLLGQKQYIFKYCTSVTQYLYSYLINVYFLQNSEQNAAVASLAQGSYWLGADDIDTEMSFEVSETGEDRTKSACSLKWFHCQFSISQPCNQL